MIFLKINSSARTQKFNCTCKLVLTFIQKMIKSNIIKYVVLSVSCQQKDSMFLDYTRTLRDTSPSSSTIKKYGAEFKRGLYLAVNLQIATKPLHLRKSFKKIHNSVLNDGRVRDFVDISIDRISKHFFTLRVYKK